MFSVEVWLVYCLILNVHIRVRQIGHSKAQFAGNVENIVRNCNAAVGYLAISLRVSRETATAALRLLEIFSIFPRKRALH